jgi:hypothetical protein
MMDQLIKFLDNPYTVGALTIGFVLYGGLAAPRLPERLKGVFQSPLFQLPLFALIAYRANREPVSSLLVSIGFMLTMVAIQRDWVSKMLRVGRAGAGQVYAGGVETLDLAEDVAGGGYRFAKGTAVGGLHLAQSGAERIISVPLSAGKYLYNTVA